MKKSEIIATIVFIICFIINFLIYFLTDYEYSRPYSFLITNIMLLACVQLVKKSK